MLGLFPGQGGCRAEHTALDLAPKGKAVGAPDGSDHDRLGVAAQALLQQPRQRRVSEGDMHLHNNTQLGRVCATAAGHVTRLGQRRRFLRQSEERRYAVG